MTEALWVQREQFEAGDVRCPACGRPLLPDQQTQYLERAGGNAIGAALICDSCGGSVRVWFSSPVA